MGHMDIKGTSSEGWVIKIDIYGILFLSFFPYIRNIGHFDIKVISIIRYFLGFFIDGTNIKNWEIRLPTFCVGYIVYISESLG